MFYRDYAAGEIEAAAELVIENNISASDGVRHLLAYAGGADVTIAPFSGYHLSGSRDITRFSAERMIPAISS